MSPGGGEVLNRTGEAAEVPWGSLEVAAGTCWWNLHTLSPSDLKIWNWQLFIPAFARDSLHQSLVSDCIDQCQGGGLKHSLNVVGRMLLPPSAGFLCPLRKAHSRSHFKLFSLHLLSWTYSKACTWCVWLFMMTATREKSYKECEFQGQANPVVLFTAIEGGWFSPPESSKGSDYWQDRGSCIQIPVCL